MKKRNMTVTVIIIIAALVLLFMIDNLTRPCLRPGELPERYIHEHTSPQYDPESYANRRQRLNEALGDGVLIISAAARKDFYYITGFDERQGVAVLAPGDVKPFRMFVTPENPADAIWIGERYGTQEAMGKFKADTAWSLENFETILPKMINGTPFIFVHTLDQQIKKLVSKVVEEKGMEVQIKDADSIIHESRVIKDKWEIDQLQQAVDVTCKAHLWIMQTMAPGQKEYEVQAEIEYIFRKNGLSPGFLPIVGSGPNATILHHIRNDRIINDNELLLVDIGAASSGGYTADITRTYPVNRRFTPEQREIYDLVYKASEAGIKKMKPGMKMLDCNHEANRILLEGLHEIGLIPDTTVWWQKRFYIQHRVNHYIGLDVHDTGDYGYDPEKRDEHILTPEIRGRELKPGMVMTMEPGIYLQENRLDYLHELFGHLAGPEELDSFAEKIRPVYEKYAGIGVRIEDNVLITETGNNILSENLPKSSDEIEAAMKRRKW